MAFFLLLPLKNKQTNFLSVVSSPILPGLSLSLFVLFFGTLSPHLSVSLSLSVCLSLLHTHTLWLCTVSVSIFCIYYQHIFLGKKKITTQYFTRQHAPCNGDYLCLKILINLGHYINNSSDNGSDLSTISILLYHKNMTQHFICWTVTV